MSNAKELRNARRNAEDALDTLAAIESLPRRKGSLVIWGNGVVWCRLGDDEWEPLHDSEEYKSKPAIYGTYSSAHVATSSGSFAEVKQIRKLPVPSPEGGGRE